MSTERRTDWTLVARYLSDEASVVDKKKVYKMMKKDPSLRDFVSKLEMLRSQAQARREEWDLEAEWAKLARKVGFPQVTASGSDLQNKTNLSPYIRKNHFFNQYTLALRIAATIVFFLVTFYALHRFAGLSFHFESSEKLAMREIRTEPGQRVHLELSDGSSVILNASSAIRFPEQFGSGTREVELQGEAFFDVAAINGSRFLVRAQGAVIEVLGTRFEVKAWSDDPSVDVVVERGRVLVHSQTSSRQGVILYEGQMTRVPRGSEPSEPMPAPVASSIAWIDGRMLFDQAPFIEVIKQLERSYGLHVRLLDSSLVSHHLSASFSNTQSSVDVLKAISVALNMSYRQKGKNVVFFPSKAQGKNHP